MAEAPTSFQANFLIVWLENSFWAEEELFLSSPVLSLLYSLLLHTGLELLEETTTVVSTEYETVF